MNDKIDADANTDLTVHCQNVDIQEGSSYKMVKLVFSIIFFPLACTSTGGAICGRDKCGNVYQDCGF